MPCLADTTFPCIPSVHGLTLPSPAPLPPISQQSHQPINAMLWPPLQIFRAAVCDVSVNTLTLEVTGKEDKMLALKEVLEPYGEGRGWVAGWVGGRVGGWPGGWVAGWGSSTDSESGFKAGPASLAIPGPHPPTRPPTSPC